MIILSTLVGHTTSTRGSQFEVSVQARFLQTGAFDAQGVVTVPQAKLIRKLGELSADQLRLVEDAFVGDLGCEASG
jgi:mRNA interferase MazF